MFRLVLVFNIVALVYGRAPFVRPLLDGRIVGGENATIEEFPYQIAIQYKGGHHCGGALIRPNVVLSAAHCVGSTISSYSVRAGSSIHNEGGKVVSITTKCIHPKHRGLDYDVSVLLLNQPFELSESIQLISPQAAGEDVPAGTIATVTGWGTLTSGGSLSLYLQKVEVPRVSQEICSDVYPTGLTSRMSCYGFEEGGKDSCQGDSGGPLVVNGTVAGIVSWGSGCALPAVPGVYTNVANEEINDHINDCLESFQQNLF